MKEFVVKLLVIAIIVGLSYWISFKIAASDLDPWIKYILLR